MMKKNIKLMISLIMIILLIAVSVAGFSACKKEEEATTTTSTENPFEIQNGTMHDDNVIEDPFADEDEEATEVVTDKKGQIVTDKAGNPVTRVVEGGSSSQGTKKSGGSNPTTKAGGTTATTKKGSGSAGTTNNQYNTEVDENGDHWTGWY